MDICLQRGADLHMAQPMPLPLTVSCFSNIQIGFTFLVPAHLVVLKKGPLNGCVCVCHLSWFAAVFLAVSCGRDESSIYQLNAQFFTRVWQGAPTVDLYPVIISQPAGPLVILADAPVSHASNTPSSPTVWQMSSIGTSDFVPRFVFRVVFFVLLL